MTDLRRFTTALRPICDHIVGGKYLWLVLNQIITHFATAFMIEMLDAKSLTQHLELSTQSQNMLPKWDGLLCFWLCDHNTFKSLWLCLLRPDFVITNQVAIDQEIMSFASALDIVDGHFSTSIVYHEVKIVHQRLWGLLHIVAPPSRRGITSHATSSLSYPIPVVKWMVCGL